MKALTLFFCILLLVCQAQAFDYFQLSIIWSNAYCCSEGVNCIHPPVPRWTIRGFWPMLNPDKREMWCEGAPQLAPNDVAALQDKLDLYWPTFIKPSNFENWEYQWRAHGSCAQVPASEYFAKAIKLFENSAANMSSVLDKDILIPGPPSCHGNAKVEL